MRVLSRRIAHNRAKARRLLSTLIEARASGVIPRRQRNALVAAITLKMNAEAGVGYL
jgi:hypothetical protein